MSKELLDYKYQLNQIEELLTKNPTSELRELALKLQSLISVLEKQQEEQNKTVLPNPVSSTISKATIKEPLTMKSVAVDSKSGLPEPPHKTISKQIEVPEIGDYVIYKGKKALVVGINPSNTIEITIDEQDIIIVDLNQVKLIKKEMPLKSSSSVPKTTRPLNGVQQRPTQGIVGSGLKPKPSQTATAAQPKKVTKKTTSVDKWKEFQKKKR